MLLEKEAITLAFNNWFIQLSDEQKIELLPKMFNNNASGEKVGKSKILESSVRRYFEVEIWPEKKSEITQQTVKEDETSFLFK